MRDKKKQIRLRNRRFVKNQRRKIFHEFNVANYHKRQALFDQWRNEREIIFTEKVAPAVFSLIDNRDETIGYLNAVDGMLRSRTYTRMNFSATNYTDMPTVCTLSAYMVDPRTSSRYLQVTIPGKTRPNRKIWDEAQFENAIMKNHELNYGSGGFLSRSANVINNDLINDILKSSAHLFGKKNLSKIRELGAIINELVENTIYHADEHGNLGALDWLINSRDVPNDGKLIREYCLVDLGVGVYDSIMTNVARWNSVRSKVRHRLSSIIDEQQSQTMFLSKNIPTGIGSRTNQTNRGKGIRHIHELAQNPIYDRFDIITNKARVNLKDPSMAYEDSQNDFSGTVYYWRISIDG